MSTDLPILVYSNDPTIIDLLTSVVEELSHKIFVVGTSTECLIFVEDNTPELLIVDSREKSSEKDPLSLCQQLKACENAKQIPIFLISAATAEEDILKGYEAGAQEYISPSIARDEALARFKLILEHEDRFRSLEGQISSLSQMAHNAMQEASFIGSVAHFATQTAFIKDYQELADSLIEVIERFGMKAKIIAYSEFRGELHFGANDINEKEIKLMKSARVVYMRDRETSVNRFHTIKQYLISHSDNAIILAKPIPMHDEAQLGQIRDIMGHLSSLYSTRLLDIDHTNEMDAYIKANKRVMAEMESTLVTLDSTFMDNNQGLIHLIDNLLVQFQNAIHQLLLSEEQEIMLSDILNNAIENITKCYSTSADIDRSLKGILNELKSLDSYEGSTKNTI